MRESKSTYTKGLLAEKLVIEHYQILNYRLLGQRIRTPFSEVDLIFENDQSRLMVEVKLIANWNNIQGRIGSIQKKRLLKAYHYLSLRSQKPLVFNAVFIDNQGHIWSTEIDFGARRT
ncbi:MAG: YraN family protein [Bdellovibrionia bacterium]